MVRIIGFCSLGLLLSLLPQTKAHADGGDTSLIHACVAKDGTIRIVSPSTSCENNETPLHWVSVMRVTIIASKNDASHDTGIADGNIAGRRSRFNSSAPKDRTIFSITPEKLKR